MANLCKCVRWKPKFISDGLYVCTLNTRQCARSPCMHFAFRLHAFTSHENRFEVLFMCRVPAFHKSMVYFVLTVDLKLEIDKFCIIDVFCFYSVTHRSEAIRFGFKQWRCNDNINWFLFCHLNSNQKNQKSFIYLWNRPYFIGSFNIFPIIFGFAYAHESWGNWKHCSGWPVFPLLVIIFMNHLHWNAIMSILSGKNCVGNSVFDLFYFLCADSFNFFFHEFFNKFQHFQSIGITFDLSVFELIQKLFDVWKMQTENCFKTRWYIFQWYLMFFPLFFAWNWCVR